MNFRRLMGSPGPGSLWSLLGKPRDRRDVSRSSSPPRPPQLLLKIAAPFVREAAPPRVDDRLSVALAVVPLLPPTIGQTAHHPMACSCACSYEWRAARLLFRRSSRIPANLRCTSASPRRPYSSKPPPA